MKFKFTVHFLVLFVIIFFILSFLDYIIFKSTVKKENISVNRNFIFYRLEGRGLKLLVADEPEEWEQGLMFIRKPVDFNGMIFIFPDKQIRYFWNKNTFIDLDVYWLDDDKIIGRDFLPSIEKTKEIYTIKSPEPVNKVIEVIK